MFRLARNVRQRGGRDEITVKGKMQWKVDETE